MLVMLMQDTETIVKPVRLTLERFPARQDLSYAVLETEDVDTLKVAPRFSDGEREFVRRIDEYDYVPDDSDDDESRFRGVGTAAVRYFKGGLFVIAPTGGIFNRVDDYQGKANKAGRERLRAWFDRLFKSQLALSHEQPDSSLKRRTRLITSVDDRACAELLLKHISHQLLINLIDADDKLRQERSKEDSQGIIMNFGDERSDRLVKNLLDGKKNPSKKSAQRLVQSMNPSQRAEYMALVQIGRGDAGPQELLRLVELNSKAHFDESYLLEKLGNRYLRRALDRFGLEAPAASNDK